MQLFNKNDDLEVRVKDLAQPYIDNRSLEKTAFFQECYECFKLGEVLFDLDAAPLADTIQKDYFVTGFYAIFNLFKRPGTFEFYLDVFRAIFGNDVDVTFEISGPGRLQINVQVLTIALDVLQARQIESGAYVFYDLITSDGDTLVAQVPIGPKTQSAIDALMVELTPQGISVTTTLIVT